MYIAIFLITNDDTIAADIADGNNADNRRKTVATCQVTCSVLTNQRQNFTWMEEKGEATLTTERKEV